MRTILNKLFDEKTLVSLTYQTYNEYARIMAADSRTVLDFDHLSTVEQDAWISSVDRTVELTLWTLERTAKP